MLFQTPAQFYCFVYLNAAINAATNFSDFSQKPHNNTDKLSTRIILYHA